MSKYIIDDMVYDIKKSKKIVEYITKYPGTYTLTGADCWVKCNSTLYLTKNGNWWSVIEKQGDIEVKAHTESDVEKLLKRINAIEVYAKYFNELKEA